MSIPGLYYSLWNPNQMIHAGAEVICNPYEEEPMRIPYLDGEFTFCLLY